MKAPLESLALVVGVGNPDRGDDAAGLIVARLIQARLNPTHPLPLRVVEQSGDGAALIDLWRTSVEPFVYLIDTMVSGQVPGSVQRFDTRSGPLAAELQGGSSHLFGAAQAIELARALGDLPPHLIVYGIEGGSFDFGADLTPAVEAGTCLAAERILAECLQLHA